MRVEDIWDKNNHKLYHYNMQYYKYLGYIRNFNIRKMWVEGIVRYIETFSGIKLRGKKVLECGCGIGHSIPLLLKRFEEIYLLDISEDAIRFIENNILNNLTKVDKEKVYLLVHDIQGSLKIRDFDVVFCFAVLEHLPTPEKAIANIRSILAEKGVSVFTTCSPNSIFKYKDPTHINEKSGNEWYKIFRKYFAEVQITPLHYLPVVWRIFNQFYFLKVPEKVSCCLLIIAKP